MAASIIQAFDGYFHVTCSQLTKNAQSLKKTLQTEANLVKVNNKKHEIDVRLKMTSFFCFIVTITLNEFHSFLYCSSC